jgi:hypothetical protein
VNAVARPALAPLSRTARRALGALARVVTPELPAAPLDADRLVAFVESYRAHMPRGLALAFPLGLWLLEYGTWLFGFSWRPFSALPPARAAAYVERWIRAPGWARRQLIKGVKGLCLVFFYQDPRVLAYLGVDVDEHVRLVSAERLRRYGATADAGGPPAAPGANDGLR